MCIYLYKHGLIGPHTSSCKGSTNDGKHSVGAGRYPASAPQGMGVWGDGVCRAMQNVGLDGFILATPGGGRVGGRKGGGGARAPLYNKQNRIPPGYPQDISRGPPPPKGRIPKRDHLRGDSPGITLADPLGYLSGVSTRDIPKGGPRVFL